MLLRKVGIVGHAQDKFVDPYDRIAKYIIKESLDTAIYMYQSRKVQVVSGHCHLGGVDLWAEDAADEMHLEKTIYKPYTQGWHNGYKPRNIRIANASHEIHIILMGFYGSWFEGERFNGCYHCIRHGEHPAHVKSGACWTGWHALEKGGDRVVTWHIIQENGTIITRTVTADDSPDPIKRIHVMNRYREVKK